jgi:hypothetical protein
MARRRKRGGLKRYPKAPMHCRKALSVAMKGAHGSKAKKRAAMISFRRCAGWD